MSWQLFHELLPSGSLVPSQFSSTSFTTLTPRCRLLCLEHCRTSPTGEPTRRTRYR